MQFTTLAEDTETVSSQPPAPRLCKTCRQTLRRDSPSEFCLACRVAQRRATPILFCTVCQKQLRSDNQSGLCPAHHYTQNLKPSNEICDEPGCGATLRVTNKSGYCPNHRWLSSRAALATRVCALPGCGATLRSDNKTGYCRDHTHLARVKRSRTCTGKGCTNILGNANKSGLCGDCWNKANQQENKNASRKRQADFRARQKEKLAKLEQLEAMGAPQSARRGRRPQDETKKTYFIIGKAVEARIPSELKKDRTAIIKARKDIAADRRLEGDVVAQYHKRFRRVQSV
jgi:hypothetical protein